MLMVMVMVIVTIKIRKICKVVELVGGGSVIKGAYPSSFAINVNYLNRWLNSEYLKLVRVLLIWLIFVMILGKKNTILEMEIRNSNKVFEVIILYFNEANI